MATTSEIKTIPVEYENSGRIFRKRLAHSALMWVLLLPVAAIVIIPIIYMFSMAFTTEANQLKYPIQWIPNPVTITNFTHILADKTLPIVRWFGNSLLVSIVGTAITVLLATLSGYAFACLVFPG